MADPVPLLANQICGPRYTVRSRLIWPVWTNFAYDLRTTSTDALKSNSPINGLGIRQSLRQIFGIRLTSADVHPALVGNAAQFPSHCHGDYRGQFFATVTLILSAKTADDKGYFGEKLAAARQEIVLVWRARAARLGPNTRGTDILGSLVVASQLLNADPHAQRRVLVIFSDMLESTPHLNFEIASGLRLDKALNAVDRGRFLANLSGVEVYAIGTEEAGYRVADWDLVRQFWATYFTKAGANLKAYSILRPLPELQ